MPLEGPLPPDEFAALMDPLGPFEPAPRLAVAVSGGADSLCLCLLADVWARQRGGSVIALVVDHALRDGSAGEALLTSRRLARRGTEAAVLPLAGLERGPALAERARAARYDALLAACAARGALHLLLGHHAGDQAETRLIRARSDSGPAGLAGMAALRETGAARLLRPLLPVAPERLRATLQAAGIDWVEDPSNRDEAALRVRLRPAARADREALCAAARADGGARARAEAQAAAELAEVTLRPEGFAVVHRPRLGPAAWSALIQTIGGSPYPPPSGAVARLAARPGPCTLAGVRLASSAEGGIAVMREAAAVAQPAPARRGVLWDRRFRLLGPARDGATVGALGADATRLRDRSGLPAAVLRTLPALRLRGELAAAPHVGFGEAGVRIAFDPPRPAACAPFVTGA